MDLGSMKNGMMAALLGMGALTTTGCLFGDGETAPAGGPKTAPEMKCADLNPEQKRRGDSIAALAQEMQAQDVAMMADFGSSEWQRVDEARVRRTLGLYDQALAAAPGHCNAIFGRALAQSMLLLQDEGVNESVSGALGKQGGSPLAKAFKAPREEAAPLVLRVAAGLNGPEKPLITATQERIAEEFLPGLDTVIASLDAVMKGGDFAATFSTPEGTFEIDKGEIGPVLGGLKVVKSIVLLLCGVQLEIADDGGYAWIDRLDRLRPSDFKALQPDQKAALDHFVGLFRAGSPFTRPKPAWKEPIRGIPDLLVEAVENTQAGLFYALDETKRPGSQAHDLYRVGLSETDDVDPADLLTIIDALERTKKYLKGQATVAWRGAGGGSERTLDIVFPKVFAWDGIQGYFPHVHVRPYQEWVAPRAEGEYDWFTGYPREGGFAHSRVLQALDLPLEDDIMVESRLGGGFDLVLRAGSNERLWTSAYDGPDVVLASFSPVDGNPCRLAYTQSWTRTRVHPATLFAGTGAFDLQPKTAQGTLDLSAACRVETDGTLSYRDQDPLAYQEPFWFTDGSGRKTLGLEEAAELAGELGMAKAFTGRIVFPDPTFGGVFPGLTNQTIWEVIASLEDVSSRVGEECVDKDGWVDCRPVMAENPSDLDVWAYHLNWLDNLF